MATNHTTNYELSQWLSTDQVLRTDFNADNAKIDAALADKAEQADLDVLSTAVAQKANQSALNTVAASITKIAFGTYTGDGTNTRTISLGLTPKAVLVLSNWGASTFYEGIYQYFGGHALQGHPMRRSNQGGQLMAIVTGGFQVTYSLSQYESVCLNEKGMAYYYIAFYT